tara:strand:- start:700 stop:1113 length:414 start_codon:yes stop_codon:yes gene_type:complete
MTNIVQFPNNENVDNLTTQITVLQEQILGRFESLTEHYVESRKLEEECNELQVRYDALIMKYAGAVGSENIPIGMLEHATNVLASYDGDNEEILLELDTGTEEPVERVKTGDKSVDEIAEFMDTITNFLRKKMDELQ